MFFHAFFDPERSSKFRPGYTPSSPDPDIPVKMPRRNGAVRQSVAAMLRYGRSPPDRRTLRGEVAGQTTSNACVPIVRKTGQTAQRIADRVSVPPAPDPPDSKTTHRDGTNKCLEILRLPPHAQSSTSREPCMTFKTVLAQRQNRDSFTLGGVSGGPRPSAEAVGWPHTRAIRFHSPRLLASGHRCMTVCRLPYLDLRRLSIRERRVRSIRPRHPTQRRGASVSPSSEWLPAMPSHAGANMASRLPPAPRRHQRHPFSTLAATALNADSAPRHYRVPLRRAGLPPSAGAVVTGRSTLRLRTAHPRCFEQRDSKSFSSWPKLAKSLKSTGLTAPNLPSVQLSLYSI